MVIVENMQTRPRGTLSQLGRLRPFASDTCAKADTSQPLDAPPLPVAFWSGGLSYRPDRPDLPARVSELRCCPAPRSGQEVDRVGCRVRCQGSPARVAGWWQSTVRCFRFESLAPMRSQEALVQCPLLGRGSKFIVNESSHGRTSSRRGRRIVAPWPRCLGQRRQREGQDLGRQCAPWRCYATSPQLHTHDLDRIMGHFAEDTVVEGPRGPERWGQRLTGHEAVRQRLRVALRGHPRCAAYRDDTHFVAGNRGLAMDPHGDDPRWDVPRPSRLRLWNAARRSRGQEGLRTGRSEPGGEATGPRRCRHGVVLLGSLVCQTAQLSIRLLASPSCTSLP